MSIQLSPRLAVLAALVPPGAHLIDVGTDHAMLPVYLVQSGSIAHAWAADIRSGPLDNAAKLVDETHTADRIDLRLTNGLCGFGPADGDTVTIAGMGGETIRDILADAPWTKCATFMILGPQSKIADLRQWLSENGYRITGETLVEDRGRIYPILTVVGGDAESYMPAEYHTGRLSMIAAHPLFPRYLNGLIRKASAEAPFNPRSAELLTQLRKIHTATGESTMPTVNDIFIMLAEKAPVEKKLDFDNVGLLVGRKDAQVTKVVTALDITDDVIDRAIREGAELIVSHHPLFFSLKSFTEDTWEGARALTLAEHKIAAICMHTNLDAAHGGVNDALMAALGIPVTGDLDPVSQIGRVGELPTSMPLADFLPHVRDSLHANGLRYHDAGRPVQKVAVCGGSGGGEIDLAVAAGCDTYVTADIKYDPFLSAKHLGINLIDADHFCTENVVVPVLKNWIETAFPTVTVTIADEHQQTAQFYV